MATRDVKYCDVYGTATDVKTYKLILATDQNTLIERSIDLSPRAVKRLTAWITRGTSKPGIEADNAK